MYKFYIISDNDEGVLVKVCNLFTARGLSIETIFATPLTKGSNTSSVELTVEMSAEKLANLREKILQIVPVHEVRVYHIQEILFN